MVTLGAVFKSSGERSGDRGGDRTSRNLDRRGSRRLLVGEIPLQMERLRSNSPRWSRKGLTSVESNHIDNKTSIQDLAIENVTKYNSMHANA